jgi:hypothetical protein
MPEPSPAPTPAPEAPAKKKRPGCLAAAFGSVLLILTAFYIAGSFMEDQPPPAAVPALADSPAAPDTAQADQEFDEQEWEAGWADLQKRAAEVKPELAALFDELRAMREMPQFLEFGFSGKYRAAAVWKQKVEECRTRLEKDHSVPAELGAVPAYLLSLSLHWIQSKGETNSDVEWDIEMINAGLN